MLLAKLLQYLAKGTDFVHLITIKINRSQCSVKLHYHPEPDQISLMLSLPASRYKSWTVLHAIFKLYYMDKLVVQEWTYFLNRNLVQKMRFVFKGEKKKKETNMWYKV